MEKRDKYIDNSDLSWKSLDKVQINFIEMRRQCRRIEEIRTSLVSASKALVSAVKSLNDILEEYAVDISGLVEVQSKLDLKIFTIISGMDKQVNLYTDLNEEIKSLLERKVNELFEYVGIDAYGNKIYDSVYEVVDSESDEKINYSELREKRMSITGDNETSMNDDINDTNLSGKTNLEQNEILISELNYNKATGKVVNLDGYNAPIIIDDIINTNPGEIDAYLYGKAMEIGLTDEQAKMSIAISRYETTDYSSDLLLFSNNWGGTKIGSSSLNGEITIVGKNFVKYTDLDQGATDFLLSLKRCFDKGCTSLADIQKSYCNDTDSDGNSHWLNMTSGVYKDRFVDYDRVMER